MITYNVAVTVVELVEAKSPEDARKIFEGRLAAAGFIIHDEEHEVMVSDCDVNGDPQ